MKAVHVLTHGKIDGGNGRCMLGERGLKEAFERLTIVLGETGGCCDIEVMLEAGDVKEDGVPVL